MQNGNNKIVKMNLVLSNQFCCKKNPGNFYFSVWSMGILLSST